MISNARPAPHPETSRWFSCSLEYKMTYNVYQNWIWKSVFRVMSYGVGFRYILTQLYVLIISFDYSCTGVFDAIIIFCYNLMKLSMWWTYRFKIHVFFSVTLFVRPLNCLTSASMHNASACHLRKLAGQQAMGHFPRLSQTQLLSWEIEWPSLWWKWCI